jgi:hypothetical protein
MKTPPDAILIEADDEMKQAAVRASLACGMTVSQLAKAALVSKLNEFTEHGQVTFGPGKKGK